MTDPYGLLFQRLLYPAWESGLRRRPTLSHLERLEQTQWYSADALRALQGTELQKVLSHAWLHTPHYRRRFEAAGLHPSDVRSVDDLAKLPLLTREEATASSEDRKSRRAPLPDIRKMTSGTTGIPMAFAYDRGSEYWRQAMKLRGYGWAGYQPGDRSLHFWGNIAGVQRPRLSRKVKSKLDHVMRREHYVDCTDHSDVALAGVVERIQALQPSVIVCYAQSGAALARHVVETGCRTWKDITVISAAERLFPPDRATMTEAFGPGIFETYGSREVMLIATECPAHDGLHVSMENLIVEIVVREGASERPARPGEIGEVVVTDLHNFGSPFIRYVNGDLATCLAETGCACGRQLSRLGSVEGRAMDTLRDGTGRPVGGMFFAVLFSTLANKVRAFQVVQRKDRSIDVLLVPGAAFDDSVLEAVKQSGQRAVPGVVFRTQVVQEIPAGPGGKLRVVVVET